MLEKELIYIQSVVDNMEHQLAKYHLLEDIKPIDSLNEVLRKERKKQKLTLKQLSELSGVSYSSLVKLESGDYSVNFEKLRQVTDTLGIKIWIG